MEEKKQEKKLSFDEALRELETIVMQLNSGTLPLEESMTAFDRGVKLGKFCNEKLTAAEKKIETLTRQPDGTVTTQPATLPEDFKF